MNLKDKVIKRLGGYTKQEYDNKRTVQEKKNYYIKTELEPVKCKITRHYPDHFQDPDHFQSYFEKEDTTREQRLWNLFHNNVVDFILKNKLFSYWVEKDWLSNDVCEVLEINFLKPKRRLKNEHNEIS